MTDGSIENAWPIKKLPSPQEATAFSEILNTAFDLGMPGKSDPVRILSDGFIRPEQRRIPYNVGRIPYHVDGVMRTIFGPRYWHITGCWYTDTVPVWRDWHGYRFEIIGRVIDPLRDSTHPFEIPVLYPERPNPIRVEVWQMRAFSDRSPIAAEITWLPDSRREQSEVPPPPNIPRHDLQAAKQGLRLLQMVSLEGRPLEDGASARRRLLTGALRLKRELWAVDRDGLARETDGVGSTDGVADLLRRAGWSMAGRRGKPSLKDIAAAADTLRSRRNLDVAPVVALAEQLAWDPEELARLARDEQGKI